MARRSGMYKGFTLPGKEAREQLKSLISETVVPGSNVAITVDPATGNTVVSAAGAGGESIEIPGPTGPTGLRGPTGLTGGQGIAGIQGNIGPIGPTGMQGNVGSTGPGGLAGTNGAVGATGPQGNQGSIGPTGNQGIAGVNGSNGAVGATGPQGLQGLQGIQGTQGSVGSVGPTGAIGANGAQGIPGPTGSQGLQGVQGTIGATGPQGLQGIQGNVGTPGTVGATGPQGLQGTAGTVGPTGASGTAATRVEVLSGIIDGGDYDLSVGQQVTVYVPFACTVTGKFIALDVAGNVTVDVWNRAIASGLPADANSITASAPITTGSAIVGVKSTVLTGWTIALAADTLLTFNVDATPVGVKKAVVGLIVTVP